MSSRRRSVETFKALAQDLGIKGLADLHAESVRDRQPPPRLVARLLRSEETRLTPREREVMVLLTSGFSQREIAAELGISYETAKHHLSNIYRKLGVGNRVQAINAFLEEEV